MKERTCKKCNKVLSIYNHSDICFACQEAEAREKLFGCKPEPRAVITYKRDTCRCCNRPDMAIVSNGLCGRCKDILTGRIKGPQGTDREMISALLSEGKTDEEILSRGFKKSHVLHVRITEMEKGRVAA